jgi:hypothetical protein
MMVLPFGLAPFGSLETDMGDHAPASTPALALESKTTDGRPQI